MLLGRVPILAIVVSKALLPGTVVVVFAQPDTVVMHSPDTVGYAPFAAIYACSIREVFDTASLTAVLFARCWMPL